MGIGAVEQRYCGVCGTGHASRGGCPGDLRATGEEVAGWRVHVETPFGNEAIGILLAPSDDQWRARIVTYPNVLWTVPGGRGTLKFVGNTPQEAEAQAIVFIEQHVLARRYLRRDAMIPVSPRIGQSAASVQARHAFAAALRKQRCLPLRFGSERAITRGQTFNLSTDGLFVGAPTPEDGGRSLLIHLELQGHTLPLRGLVMWSRWHAEPERPAGMGIRLSNPPAVYRSYVDALT